MMDMLFLGGLVLLAPIVLVLSLLSLLILFNSINAFQLIFISSFRVDNRTAGPIWITPVATLDSGRKGVVMPFLTRFPAFHAFRSKHIPLAPGRSARILYQFDHVICLEILICNAEGECRQFNISPDPFHAGCKDPYRIENWDSLPPATEDVLAAARETKSQLRIWLVLLSGLIAGATYLWLLDVYLSR